MRLPIIAALLLIAAPARAHGWVLTAPGTAVLAMC